MSLFDFSFSHPVQIHSRPLSPSFLGHLVGKRGALEAAVTGCQKISEVTNITARALNGFLSLTAPLGEKFYFLSSLQRVASLDVLKMYHFTQLGFTDNLENLKKTVTETGRTHRWFAELRQLIGRLSSELCESNIAKIDIMRVKVNLKKYLVSCPATAILLQAIFGHK